jgi:hypothetical protein
MDENTKPEAPKNEDRPTESAKLLTREMILARQSLVAELVNVAEWGGTVRVRELTGAERDKYEAALVRMQKGGKTDLVMDNARARLVSLAVIDASGARVFTEADVVKLGNLSAVALNRVFDVAARLSKITEEDLGELAGN